MSPLQAALLGGYLYAHLLQRIPSVRGQAMAHIAALVVADGGAGDDVGHWYSLDADK